MRWYLLLTRRVCVPRKTHRLARRSTGSSMHRATDRGFSRHICCPPRLVGWGGTTRPPRRLAGRYVSGAIPMSSKLFSRGRRIGKAASQKSRVRPQLELLEDRCTPATLTANSVLDNDVRDSVLTLREAIQVANGTPVNLTMDEQAQVIGVLQGETGQDTIAFNIPCAGTRTIVPEDPLPNIMQSGRIDGYTQPGAALAIATSPATLKINLLSSAGNGLTLASGSSVVRGLSIRGVGGPTIYLGPDSFGNIIEGNHLTQSLEGVEIDGSSNNVIGGISPGVRNVISDNMLGVDSSSSAAT